MSTISPGHLHALLTPPPPPPLPVHDCGDDYRQADVALIRHHGRVILVRRTVEPKKGNTCLPGGFRRIGERGNAAAARELREEASIAFPAYRLAHLWTYFVAGPGITLRFWIGDWDEQFDGPLPEFIVNNESSERLLADPANLPPDMAFDSHIAAIQMAFGIS